MNYETILYDIDGTLFDYRVAEETAFQKTMQNFGLDIDLDIVKEEYVRINSELWQQFENNRITAEFLRVERFRLLLKSDSFLSCSDKITPDQISDYYIKRLSENTFLLPEAREIVEYFHDRIKQVLISNGLVDVQIPRVRNSELNNFFEQIFISEEIGYPKPHPGIFKYVFDKLKIDDKKKVIIIGDNLGSDIKGGNDFGIDTCWFNPNKLPNNSGIIPKYEIRRLIEIKKIVEGGEK